MLRLVIASTLLVITIDETDLTDQPGPIVYRSAIVSGGHVARTIEPRSIYDARLTDEEVETRQKARELPPR